MAEFFKIFGMIVISFATAGILKSLVSNSSFSIYLIFGVATVINPAVRVAGVAVYLSNAFILLWFASIAAGILSGKQNRAKTVIDGPILLFILIAIASTMWFGFQTPSIKRTIALSIFTFAYFATTNYIGKNYSNFTLLAKWCAIGGGLAGLSGLVSLFYNPFRGASGRGAGAFGNPNPLANFLLMTTPLILLLIYRERHYFSRLLWGLAACFAAALGFFSAHSRGAFMALSVYPLAAVTVTSKRTGAYILLIFSILAAGHIQMALSGQTTSYPVELVSFVLKTPELYSKERRISAKIIDSSYTYSSPQWTRIGEFDHLPNSLGARMMIWAQAIHTFRENPIFGKGIGLCLFSAIPYDCKNFDIAFNNTLTVATEMGLIGLTGYLLLLYFTVVSIIAAFRKAQNYEQKLLAAAMLAGLAAFHIHALVEDPIFAIMCNWMYGILTGMIATAPGAFAESPNDRVEAN